MERRRPIVRFNATGCIVLPVALFIGLMIATAGMAIYPRVTAVAMPLICAGKADYVSTGYSYRPGQYGVQRTIYCDEGGRREEITMTAIGVSFLIYSAAFFLLLQFVARPLIRRRYRDTLDAVRARVPPGAGSSAAQGAGGMVDVQDILARVSEAMRRGEANVVVRGMALDADGDDDPAGRLAQLKALRDQGLISAADYEAKKAEILSRL